MINYESIGSDLIAILDVPVWKKVNPERSVVLILPGMQDYRIHEGAKKWPEIGKYLWVAGTRADPFYSRRDVIEKVGKERVEEMGLSGLYNVETQGWANNTLDQMRWVTALLKKYPDINHVALITAAYHTPRCTLTLLQTMNKESISDVVISPTPINPAFGPSFESDEFQGEIVRIPDYQKKGDIATFEVWKDYLEWRDSR